MKRSGIVSDGASNYIEALEREAKLKLRELESALAKERESERRNGLLSEMRAINEELERKSRGAIRSLF